MKAKEYAKRYTDEGKTSGALYRVWLDMVYEFEAIVKQRNATSDAAAIAIIHELDQKWRAFARLAGAEVKPDGFMDLIKYKMPDVYSRIKP